MDSQKLTTKSQEALSVAIREATRAGNPQVETVQVLLALLGQVEGTTRPLLEAVGVDRAALAKTVEAAAERAAVGQRFDGLGAHPGPQHSQRHERRRRRGPQARRRVRLDRAPAGRPGRSGSDATADLLKKAGATPQALREAFTKVRGSAPGDVAGPGGDLSGAGEVRRRPDRLGAGRQAGPGHRPRRRDPPGGAGALPPDQEQPGADRRARRRQDRRRRGPGPAHRRRRRAGERCATSAWCPWTWARWWPARSTAASSRSG